MKRRAFGVMCKATDKLTDFETSGLEKKSDAVSSMKAQRAE